MTLIERLRGLNAEHPPFGAAHEAATEIDRLTAERDALKAELGSLNVIVGRMTEVFKTETDALKADVAAKQAKIDALMLEYCPQEMTPDQITEWKKHQCQVDSSVAEAIDNAMKKETP